MKINYSAQKSSRQKPPYDPCRARASFELCSGSGHAEYIRLTDGSDHLEAMALINENKLIDRTVEGGALCLSMPKMWRRIFVGIRLRYQRFDRLIKTAVGTTRRFGSSGTARTVEMAAKQTDHSQWSPVLCGWNYEYRHELRELPGRYYGLWGRALRTRPGGDEVRRAS